MAPILKRGLIVSCQAEGNSPFNAPEFIVAFARAAEKGGAVAVRVCGIENIKAVRQAVTLPIIGITKGSYPNGEILITPTLEEGEAIIEAGASLLALDATRRVRPIGLTGGAMVRAARKRFAVPLMADVSRFKEGAAAVAAGADFVGTTLSGYTRATREKNTGLPDVALVETLAAQFPGRVIAEGRIWTPQQAAAALKRGAYAVVVGTAITRPIEIVKRFVGALPL